MSNVKLEKVEGRVKGEANFISIETWHGGTITLTDVTLNLVGDDNTVFYFYSSEYGKILGGNSTNWQKGGIEGDLDISITGQRNNVYLVMGTSGSFDIESSGQYTLEVAGNIVYSVIGYSPDFLKFAGTGSIATKPKKKGVELETKDWKPIIKLSTAPVSYGDENIILFFSDQLNNANSQTVFGTNNKSW